MHLPHWPITRRLRRRPALRTEPAVVVAMIRRAATVIDASPHAARAGARVGLTLAEARMLCPAVTAIDHDPAGDKRSLDALGRWMTRFTPSVATGWADDTNGAPGPSGSGGSGKSADAPPSPPLLMLDVTGCERLFGSIDCIVHDVTAALARFGLPARVAAAPTVGAAWALAATGSPADGPDDHKCGQVVNASQLRRALSPLPVGALRLPEPVLKSLRRLGLDTIGRLLEMPRASLPSRFGPLLITRLDQLLGRRPEPLNPLAYDPPVEAKMTFEHTIDSLDTLWLVLQELLRRVVADLERRGHGARRLELTCVPDQINGPAGRWPTVTRTVDLNRPARDPARLFALLRSAAENLNCGNGFVSVGLKVLHHERVTDEQIGLLDDRAHADAMELGRLVERLSARLGGDTILRPALVESYIPERAWRPAEPDDTAARATNKTATRPAATNAAPLAPRDISAAARTAAPRPLHLLKTPTEIAVIAEPSDGWSGRPAQFTHAGRVHRLARVIGPERVAGEWWRGHLKTRDYYDALDDTGRRFWVFRVVALLTNGATSKRWFLHGFFSYFL